MVLSLYLITHKSNVTLATGRVHSRRLAETRLFSNLLRLLNVQAQLKREGKEAAAQLVELQGQHQALQRQAHASSKVRQAVFDQRFLDVTSHQRI